MNLYETINEDIKTAMKSKDQQKLDVLRMMKTKIMTVDARGNLPPEEMIKIVTSYEKSLRDAIEQSKASGRTEAIAELEQEIAIIQTYLPKKLSPLETEALVEKAVAETGASSKKDMGKVMKFIMSSGQVVDGALVKASVDKVLV